MPDRSTSRRLRVCRWTRFRFDTANEIIATAAISSLKNVSEIADVSVAYLMKMALEPKKIDATKRIIGPVENRNK